MAKHTKAATINLKETQIPTNADLVLTFSAKEDMKLAEQIVITLDIKEQKVSIKNDVTKSVTVK